jgi:hypothetical protein
MGEVELCSGCLPRHLGKYGGRGACRSFRHLSRRELVFICITRSRFSILCCFRCIHVEVLVCSGEFYLFLLCIDRRHGRRRRLHTDGRRLTSLSIMHRHFNGVCNQPKGLVGEVDPAQVVSRLRVPAALLGSPWGALPGGLGQALIDVEGHVCTSYWTRGCKSPETKGVTAGIIYSHTAPSTYSPSLSMSLSQMLNVPARLFNVSSGFYRNHIVHIRNCRAVLYILIAAFDEIMILWFCFWFCLFSIPGLSEYLPAARNPSLPPPVRWEFP